MIQLYTRTISSVLILLCMCLHSGLAHATHIRAGEITASRTDSQALTFEVTLKGYADRDSQVIFGSNGTLDFGDGTSLVINNDGDTQPGDLNYVSREALNADTWVYILKVSHTFPSAGHYIVSFREFYRNENVLNMDNSVNMPFYIETAIFIDPSVENNHTPVFKRPATDRAFVGKTYHHQPGAVDEDGDSLSYHLGISQQDLNIPVAGFRFPDKSFPEGDPRNGNSESGATPNISINHYTGDISWDAPGTRGEYSISYYVKEWRKINGKHQLLGYVMRDMQIIVEDLGETKHPQLSFPFTAGQLAPAAGEAVGFTITAYAPTVNDSVVLEIWGDFVDRANVSASSRSVRAKGEASINIEWTGEENKEQHYQLIARSYYPALPNYTRNRSVYFYFKTSTDPEENQAPEEDEDTGAEENPTPEEEDKTDPLGVQPTASTTLQAFPNPAKGGKFYLSMPEATGKIVSYQIFDTRGLLTKQETNVIMQEKHPLELSGAQKGIYLLLINANSKVYKSKLVVQ
ncbi:T9SS type A sorting domain-containing protein [Cesiribacter sp. SM1]|uniref:T9SS type A sorting domain-containing protein n=1 Tax=Cesiribacter sp. SM1 TaxID=2861196 RepID=UPI001CD46AC3|nr:T9SS type A sorting domain-containing protein [Cesiribacter sp. SM1]